MLKVTNYLVQPF